MWFSFGIFEWYIIIERVLFSSKKYIEMVKKSVSMLYVIVLKREERERER